MIHFLLYFDAGLGALIIQGIVAGAAGVILFTKGVKYKIMTMLGMKSKYDDMDDIEINDDDESTKS